MPLLRHEARRYEANGALWFGRSVLTDARALEDSNGPCDILYVVFASSQEAAMQTHYERQQWGPYWPLHGMPDIPYTAEELAQQLADYPDDRELRRLNGLAFEGL